MKKWKIFILLLLALSLVGCAAIPAASDAGELTESATQGEEVQPVGKAPVEETGITDLVSLYEGWDSTRVLTMYLTVSTGNEADSSNHTWAEVNQYSTYYYDDLGIDRYKVEGILQIDDGNGITEESFGYGAEVPNVSVQVRGQTSSLLSQKNYKIRIKEGKGSYEGQRTLNLNKHMALPYRFENNLAYTLMQNVPQLVSGRTVFVHLMVKDTTAGGSGEFEDYGLYTMVEQVNHTYMRAHGLDSTGELYKVTSFAWYPYDAVMAVGEDYDEDAFEEYMEIKGKDEHSALRSAVAALQNYQVPIEDIVDQYFDAENICYWMAFNILAGNYDSGARNLFIYSPQNSEKLYILPWDLDDSFQKTYDKSRNYSEGGSWERGITQYTSILLCKRMLKEEKYRDMLTAAVEDLHSNCFTRENLTSLIAKMSAVTEQYLFEEPDYEYRQVEDLEEYEALIAQLPDEIENNYQYYYESLNMPWPFYIGVPEASDGKIIFSWDNSYDPLEEGVTYSYQLADNYNFENPISEGTGLAIPTVTLDTLPSGNYYLKVTAENKAGYQMDCFDYISASGIGKVYGCYAFIIDEEGNILASDE